MSYVIPNDYWTSSRISCPRIPAKAGARDQDRMNFIMGLVNGASSPVQFVPDRTGFIDKDTFATHAEILRSDGSRAPIPQLEGRVTAHPTFVEPSREPSPTSSNPPSILATWCLELASLSRLPLPTYLKLRSGETGDPLLTETAVYNFSRHEQLREDVGQ